MYVMCAHLCVCKYLTANNVTLSSIIITTVSDRIRK